MEAQLLNRYCLNFMGFLQYKLLLNNFTDFQEFESSVNREQNSQQYLQCSLGSFGMYYMYCTCINGQISPLFFFKLLWASKSLLSCSGLPTEYMHLSAKKKVVRFWWCSQGRQSPCKVAVPPVRMETCFTNSGKQNSTNFPGCANGVAVDLLSANYSFCVADQGIESLCCWV